MALIGQSEIETGVTSVGFIFFATKFLRLGGNFATKFFRISGAVFKCAAKFLGVGGFLPLTTF